MIINRTENGVKNIQTAGYNGARTVYRNAVSGSAERLWLRYRYQNLTLVLVLDTNTEFWLHTNFDIGISLHTRLH